MRREKGASSCRADGRVTYDRVSLVDMFMIIVIVTRTKVSQLALVMCSNEKDL